MLGLTIFLLVFSLSSSMPVKRQTVTESESEYEYEYEDIVDENGNPIYDYYDVVTEVPVTTTPAPIPGCPPGFLCGGGVSNGAVNQNTGSTGGTKTVTIKKKKKRRRKVKKSKTCKKEFDGNGRCFMVCGKRRSRC